MLMHELFDLVREHYRLECEARGTVYQRPSVEYDPDTQIISLEAGGTLVEYRVHMHARGVRFLGIED